MIRPATPHDAAQAAPLLCAAWGSLALALTGADDDAQAARIVAGFFAQTGNRISHENALVVESDGQVAGIAVCYHGGDAEALDRPLTAQLRARTGDTAACVHIEAAPDEFYLDTLSVHPDFQRHGLGTELLQAFERRAAERGSHRLALLVEGDNTAACCLYARHGYTADGTVRLGGSVMEHRVKFLPPLIPPAIG